MRCLFPGPSESVDLDALYAHPPGVVRANMVASVDGAATLEGRSGGLSSSADHQLFLWLRTLADVVLVGATTVRAEDYGPAKPPADARRRRAAAGLAEIPPIAVVTASLDIEPTARFFTEAVVRPIVLTVDDADPARREALEAVADVVTAGHTRVDLTRGLDLLADRGLTRVLTEGGPALLGGLSGAGRLDELCLTVAPLVLSGGAKRIVDGPPLVDPLSMSLAHVLEDEGSLFLRYVAS